MGSASAPSLPSFKSFSAKLTTPLAVDGILGHHTVSNLQLFLNVNNELYLPKTRLLYHLHPLLLDGQFGPKTKTELQRFLNAHKLKGAVALKLDGDFGVKSNGALQKFLKVEEKALTPSQAKVDGIVDKAVIRALQ